MFHCRYKLKLQALQPCFPPSILPKYPVTIDIPRVSQNPPDPDLAFAVSCDLTEVVHVIFAVFYLDIYQV